jgi:low affinity Fe/Cu permease
MKDKLQRGWFTCFASEASKLAGHPYTFIAAVAVIIIWGISGPIFGYSDTWQLIINTSTTIITFLMVFLIQNSQNRDSKAVHLKLDELIRATEGAHTALLDLEELDASELEKICLQYEKIAEVARDRLKKGKKDTNIPKVILNQSL